MGVTLAPGTIETEEDGFEVWQANWDSVTAFLACETQWRLAVGAAAVWLGLDYAGVDVALRRLDLPAPVFADLQLMERAALDILNEGADG